MSLAGIENAMLVRCPDYPGIGYDESPVFMCRVCGEAEATCDDECPSCMAWLIEGDPADKADFLANGPRGEGWDEVRRLLGVTP